MKIGPRWATRLLHWFCAPHLVEELEGDLNELFQQRVASVGLREARRRYVRDVLSMLRPSVIKRKPGVRMPHCQRFGDYKRPTHPTMVRNYVKIAYRNLIKNRVYSVINIVGLSAGLTCFAFIALWVYDEFSYDTFHQHHDRIVRLTTTQKTETGWTESARTGAPVARALQQAYAEVENTVRLEQRADIVQHANQQTLQTGIVLTDPSFFQVFSYPLIRGHAATALSEPFSIVLTESMAKKYFGDADPIGKSLLIYLCDSTGRGASYTVTGLTADPPRNAHFTFTMLASYRTREVTDPDILTEKGWRDGRCYTYLLLKPDMDYQTFSAKITSFYENHIGKRLATGRSLYLYRLQPLGDIHLRSHLEREMADVPTGTISQVYLFSTIGLFILLLAGINYTNLATARSVGRAKEVGINKVVGAVKTQLIAQYLSESLFMAGIGLLVALLASVAIQPYFNGLTGKNLSLFSSTPLLLILVGVTLFLGLLAGLYPAFVLSNFKPVSVLKGAFQSSAGGIVLRKSLVISQFVITQLLITSMVIIYAQMTYIKHKELGYNKEALLFIRLNGNADVIRGYNAFKNELLASPLVSGVATSRSGILNGLEISNVSTVDRRGKPIQGTTSTIMVGSDYLAIYGLKLIAGTNLKPQAANGTIQQVILNEKAVQSWGWPTVASAIGKPFALDGKPGTVIGVVKDFHYNTLQQSLDPLAITSHDNFFSRITIRVDPTKISQALAFIEQVWNNHFPVVLFDYDFVDQQLAGLYREQERFSTLILYFSALSLLIACLGLYGLIAYSTAQRTKEIGIRKVLGATVNGIVVMLSKDFLKLVGLAGLVAVPVAGYLMARWLQDFAYRIELEWWMFAGSIALVLLIALLTISFQSIKAALTNPVTALRSE